MPHIPTLTRGDTTPALAVTISDTRADADFSTLTPADVIVKVEQGGTIIAEGPATTVTPAGDAKSAVVKRPWGAGETDVAGRCWVTVYVTPWDQTFPEDSALRLDIVRAAGDA